MNATNNPAIAPVNGEASDLLSQFQTGNSFFTSPRQSLLTRGVAAVMPACDHQSLAEEAFRFLNARRHRGQFKPILLGAIPFRQDEPAYLFSPEQCLLGRGVSGLIAGFATQASATGLQSVDVQMQPSADSYRDLVASALGQIQTSTMEKVVLSRSLTVAAEIDVLALLRRLASRNPRGYTFAVNLDGQASEQRTLVGASPELLLARHGSRVISNPLAGSIPRSPDLVEDRRRADGLLKSTKDRYEHALVVDAVAEALRPFCHALHVPIAPVLLATPTMWHLSTEIHGELTNPTTSALELACALHPTPAVCGYPTADARAFIEQSEGFDRGFFTGLTGWCDADGDGEWAITIRCAEVGDHSATLYAGAGIVAGSEPELELRETSAKLRTMLHAMQLESVLEDL